MTLHPLSDTPGCFRAAPSVQAPLDFSRRDVAFAKRSVTVTRNQGLSCIRRYERMVEAIEAAPTAGRWTVRPDPDSDLVMNVTAWPEGAGDDPEPLFFIETIKPSAGPNDRDQCSRAMGPRWEAWGRVKDTHTLIDHGGTRLRWNEEAVGITIRSPIGELAIFARGCNPATGSSFGEVTPYDFSTFRCWSLTGHFTSCAGVETWPF
jgi:hypothetical protein